VNTLASITTFAAEDGGGVHFPPIENVIEWPDMFSLGPLGFNKIGLIAFLAFLIPTIIFLLGKGSSAEKPSTFRALSEGIVNFIEEQVAKPGIGHGFEPYVPMLTAIFLFVSIGNLFEVIPFFQMPLNARMAAPVVLALSVWAMFVAVGFKHNGFQYVKDIAWPPGVPLALKPLVGGIELFSTFIVRPFSHAVRLFANMLAGHILLITFGVLCIATFKLGIISGIGFIGSFLGLIAFTAFEVGVSFIQGFVFAILAAVYIGSSLHPAH